LGEHFFSVGSVSDTGDNQMAVQSQLSDKRAPFQPTVAGLENPIFPQSRH
jgi:hypothetical protein